MDKRIRKIRLMLDLTQQEFGERIGVKRNTIATYEGGRSTPIDSVISLICREFNVNEEWLRTGVGEMFKASPTDELDALAERYGLSRSDYVLIEKYVNLKDNQRAAVMDYLLQVAAALQGAAPAAPAPRQSSEMSREELHAELDRQLDAQKEAREKS